MILSEYQNLKPTEKIKYFIDTLSVTNKTPDFFVNWEKVVNNTRKYEVELNTLNYLIGKDNIVEEATNLFTSQPNLLKAIPSLIACRDSKIDILFLKEKNMEIESLDFQNIDSNNIGKYVNFLKKSGLLDFLKKDAKRSLVDYVYGVETGLDTNARKNRSGTNMEKILTRILEDISEKFKFEHMEQATSDKILKEWNINVPVDKSIRRFDGALFDKEKNKLYVFETNYYGGGGSKLKSVSGEFQTLNNLVNTSKDDVVFVWITDGQGWRSSKIPLEEAMENIENIFNLKMIEDNFLNDLLIR